MKKLKKLLALLMVVCMSVSLLGVPVLAVEGDTPTIQFGVQKAWDDANAPEGTRPESITVTLFADDKIVEGSEAVLSAENGWAHTWTVPAGANYDARELNVPENYTVSAQLVAAVYSVGDMERIKSCSETSISVPPVGSELESADFVVVSLTNSVKDVFGTIDFVIWSKQEMSDAFKNQFVTHLQEKGEALFKNITMANACFLHAGGTNPYSEYVNFQQSGDQIVGTSTEIRKSAVWQQVLYTMLGAGLILGVGGSVITIRRFLKV